VKTVVSTVGKQVAGTRAVQKVAEPVKNVAGAVGTRVMHPTAAGVVAKQVPKQEKNRALSELGKAMEQVPVYSFARNVGADMLDVRKQLDDIIQRANEQGINIPKAHNILDFEKYIDEMKQPRFTHSIVFSGGRERPLRDTFSDKFESVLKQDLNQLDQIEAQIRAVNPQLADEVSKIKTKIDERSDGWFRQTNSIDLHFDYNSDISRSDTIWDGMWEGARAVFRREILPKDNIVYRTIDAWKRTKTIYNLGTHTRNFLQNFLFRYLTGDVDATDVFRLPTAVRDMIRFRRMVDDIARQGGNININDVLNQYPDFRDLVFILSASKNRPSLQRLVQQLREGTFRYRPRSEALVDLDDRIRAGTLAQERGIPISQLPRNWGDVLLFPFRQATEITREVRAKELPRWKKPLDWLHTIAHRAYNAGDLIPALLMETVRRRKAIQPARKLLSEMDVADIERIAQNPMLEMLDQLYPNSRFRMDYLSVPETIGLFNIALLPFVNYQYFALRGLREALRKNPERVYNIIAKPIERSTRITQADDEQGVSQAPRFGFKEREMFPVSPTRGIPYSTVLPIDPQFAEPFISLSAWASRSPITAIARPVVENRDDVARAGEQLLREFTPASIQHILYALLGEPQRGMQPTLQHTRGERLLRALGINIQPIDQMRIAKQQQREAERKRNEPLYDDPATITGIVNRILRYFGW
jgi:hypothetical protein